MSEKKYTEGSWEFSIYGLPVEMIEQQRRLGIEPTRMLSNDGSTTIMGGPEDDRRPVARVECQAPFKRGQGHKSECAERDANARLIAAAPDLLAALEALSSNPRLNLGDLIYTVREREGEGWDGPAVTAWNDAVMAAKAAIAKARGE